MKLDKSKEPKPDNLGYYPFEYEFTIRIKVESGEDSCYLAEDAKFNYKNALQAGLEEAETQVSDMVGEDGWAYSDTVNYTDESDEAIEYKEAAAWEYFKNKGFNAGEKDNNEES
jgi:hypothetical protein